MSDGPALLRAIWDEPHDDTPRLVYADWLQETGDPANVARAEFIRVQCELARTDEVDPRHDELRGTVDRLWAKYRGVWKAGLPGTFRSERFHRGFLNPHRVAKGVRFLALRTEDLAPAPLWGYELRHNSRGWKHLVDCENLRRVGSLSVPNWLEAAGSAERLAASPHARNLSHLSAGTNRPADDVVRELAAAADGLPFLRSLILGGNDPTLSGITALARSGLGPQLTNAPIGELGDDSLRLLADESVFPALTSAYFQHWGRTDRPAFTAAGFRAFFRSPHRTRIRRVGLSTTRLGPSEVEAIVGSAPVFRMTYFDLCVREFDDERLEAVAGWAGLADVRELSISGFPIRERGALALARSPHLGRVTRLRLIGSLLTRDFDARKALVARFGKGLDISRW